MGSNLPLTLDARCVHNLRVRLSLINLVQEQRKTRKIYCRNGFYFVSGSSALEGARESNIFGVWDLNENLRSFQGCSHHKPTPQILLSSDGSLISLRDPGLCLLELYHTANRHFRVRFYKGHL